MSIYDISHFWVTEHFWNIPSLLPFAPEIYVYIFLSQWPIYRRGFTCSLASKLWPSEAMLGSLLTLTFILPCGLSHTHTISYLVGSHCFTTIIIPTHGLHTPSLSLAQLYTPGPRSLIHITDEAIDEEVTCLSLSHLMDWKRMHRSQVVFTGYV